MNILRRRLACLSVAIAKLSLCNFVNQLIDKSELPQLAIQPYSGVGQRKEDERSAIRARRAQEGDYDEG